jgi:hypothetical protein
LIIRNASNIRSVRRVRTQLAMAVAVVCLTASSTAHALDKQASAHAGQLSGAASGFALTGGLLAGAALYNPTFAARPDNSGHALGRVAPHFDIDLIGSRLSIPIDVNVFTDRDRPGLGKLAPSELDVISGLTTTWPLGGSALELGARVEGDFPVDRGGLTQSYADARARWLFSLANFWPDLQRAMQGGDISGAATLGWFIYNPTYAARPDNTGRALFRYAAHVTLQYTKYFFVGLDATFFTDRRNHPLTPSELDFTPELGAKLIDGLDLHLAYERDMPLDRSTPDAPRLVQHFLMLYLTWGFSLVAHPP